MLDEFRRNLKVKFSNKENTLAKDKSKISAKDLVVCQFYKEGEKTLRILQRSGKKGENVFKRKIGQITEIYKDIETKQEMKKIIEYDGGIAMLTKFVSQEAIDYIRIQ